MEHRLVLWLGLVSFEGASVCLHCVDGDIEEAFPNPSPKPIPQPNPSNYPNPNQTNPNRTQTQVLSSSFDGTVRVHGLKSGKMLKEFRGHTSYVNGAIFSTDGLQVISCSSDATVRVWDAKSCEQLHAFRCVGRVMVVRGVVAVGVTESPLHAPAD